MAKQTFKFAPLKGGYMATSMLGILISLVYVYPYQPTWAVAAALVFGIMFMASIISMTVANPDDFVEIEEMTKKRAKKKK